MNEILEKKLNIFQKIRKGLYLFRLNSNKANNYTTLPSYLQNDPEVANRVVEVSPSLINHLSTALLLSTLTSLPDAQPLIQQIKNINLL